MFLSDQFLGERTSNAFSENRDLAANIDTLLKVPLGFSGTINPLVASTHADDLIPFSQHLNAGKPGKQVDATLFDTLSQPTDKLVEGHDEVAMIAKRRWRDGQRERPALGEVENAIVIHRTHGRAELTPIRNEFGDPARIHNSAGKDVGADL